MGENFREMNWTGLLSGAYLVKPGSHVRKSRYKFLPLIIIIIIGCAAIAAWAIFNQGSADMNKKVLVIGIDAFDPNVVDALMAQGKMPNFQRLMQNGSYSRLETTIPAETPVAWSSAATGSNPGNHGIYDFITRDPGNYIPELSIVVSKQGITGTKYDAPIRGTPFWDITSSKGISTTVIRWPATFPADKVSGNFLSGLGTVDVQGYLNGYRFYTSNAFDNTTDGGKRSVLVAPENGTISTVLYGPLVRKSGGVGEAEKPMGIIVNESNATLMIDGSAYNVSKGNWSQWIRVRYKTDFLTEVYGIFQVYLIDTDPFQMYMTSLQIDPSNQVADITYPKSYGKELEGQIGLFNTLGQPEETKAVTDGVINKSLFLEQNKMIEAEREKMFWFEFNRFDKGVLAFGFDAGDRLQHIFWANKVINRTGPLIIPKEIEDYYVGKDRLIGQVLDRIDSNTTLIVFSDHGFNSFERAVSINRWLVNNGYMTLKSEPPPGDDGGLFAYVDWSKTRAYSLGFSSIFINEKGREGQGIVDKSQKDQLVSEIISKLSNLTDDKYGTSAIKTVYRGSDIYFGNFTDDAPDIVVGFQAGYRMSWQNAVGGITPQVLLDNDDKWTGDHLIDHTIVPGVLFTNFKVTEKDPKIWDIAPTILKELKISIPKGMDGKNLA